MARSRYDIFPISTTTFGRLIKAEERQTKEPYEGWRKSYINHQGLIVFHVYLKPGYPYWKAEDLLIFYPRDPMSPSQKYLRTSLGKTEIIGDNVFKFTTSHSVYTFEVGSFYMTKAEMRSMYLWAIRGHICDKDKEQNLFNTFWNGPKRNLLPEGFIIEIDTPLDRDPDYKPKAGEQKILDELKEILKDYNNYSFFEPREGAMVIDKTKYVGWITFRQIDGKPYRVIAHQNVVDAAIFLAFETLSENYTEIIETGGSIQNAIDRLYAVGNSISPDDFT